MSDLLLASRSRAFVLIDFVEHAMIRISAQTHGFAVVPGALAE